MIDQDRIELASCAIAYGVNGMQQVLPLMARWNEEAAAKPEWAKPTRELATSMLETSGHARKQNSGSNKVSIHTSMDWLHQ